MVTITAGAEQKIRELMKEEQDAVGLRVYVRGGGCHGYQYGMSFESKIGEDDSVIEKGDIKVILDSQSAPLLSGAEVDYVDSLQGSGFAIKNPQAKTTCGCGSSFTA
ncbi:MAG TPA: iron-sulfur cluster insertion protein ErpA [Nitrospiraceae bacterium]|jgi:iron-sulfur cluster insertion protein|nr:iron-sulfur cluster insertion protein ErpA [Nitrospiraceae bacterium]